MDVSVKDQVPGDLLRFKPQAYLKESSVETAIPEVVLHVEVSVDLAMYFDYIFFGIDNHFIMRRQKRLSGL